MEAVAGPVAGAVVGGLMGGDSQQSQTASKEPWSAAAPWLRENLRTGQGLQNYYQQNPFNPQQQTAYQNIFGDLDAFRNQMAPGLMGFANRLMGSSYQRGGSTAGANGGGLLAGGAQPTGGMMGAGSSDMNQALQQLRQVFLRLSVKSSYAAQLVFVIMELVAGSRGGRLLLLLWERGGTALAGEELLAHHHVPDVSHEILKFIPFSLEILASLMLKRQHSCLDRRRSCAESSRGATGSRASTYSVLTTRSRASSPDSRPSVQRPRN